jgi:hypothetical protein
MPGTVGIHDRTRTERRPARLKTEGSGCEEGEKDSPDDEYIQGGENHSQETAADIDKPKEVAAYAGGWDARVDGSCHFRAQRDGIAEDTRMKEIEAG